MAFPVHPQRPGDDPERTDVIPVVDAYVEPRAWRPNAPNRPDGAFGDGPHFEEIRPQGDAFDADPAFQGRPRRRLGRKKPLWKELLTLLAVSLLMTFLIQTFLGRFYLIPSGSMEKTLHGCANCDNDRVLVDKLTYAFTDPEPGDVVVFEGPDSWSDDYDQASTSGNVVTNVLQSVGALVGLAPANENDFVKRVIAVGGQTVQCCDPKGRVLVDGRALNEPYIYWQNGKPNSRQRFDPIVVPEGKLWVMGDNRNNSKDSRFQDGGGLRGVVPIDNVIGKARFIVLPPSRWSGVGDHDPQPELPSAMGAPAWQQGLPAGVGFLVAFPALWLGRRAGSLIRPLRTALPNLLRNPLRNKE